MDTTKCPTYPNLPKSELLSKLEAFLPVLAEENRKLSEAAAAGRGARHNIEVIEDEKQAGDECEDVKTSNDEEVLQKGDKAPVIEMKFALGMIDEAPCSSLDVDLETDLMAQVTATVAKEAGNVSPKFQHHEVPLFQLQLEKPSKKPRPVIQELN